MHREGETVQQALDEAAELAESGYEYRGEAEAEIVYDDEVEPEAEAEEEEPEAQVEEPDEA